jgi:uncharacterized membrane protein YhaH (DUF805 family)
MTFTESISTVFRKYATFTGTASRSEFWWFWLFVMVVSILLSRSDVLGAAFGLATLVPQLSVGCRRLHDTDRSGWWQLLWFVPIIGWIVLIVFLVQESRQNRYGEPASVDMANPSAL